MPNLPKQREQRKCWQLLRTPVPSTVLQHMMQQGSAGMALKKEEDEQNSECGKSVCVRVCVCVCVCVCVVEKRERERDGVCDEKTRRRDGVG